MPILPMRTPDVPAIHYRHIESLDDPRRKQKYACFTCRVSFPLRDPAQNVTRCPRCGEKLWAMGKLFKPPKKTGDLAWEAVQLLRRAGVLYTSAHDDLAWTISPRLDPAREHDRRFVWTLLLSNGFWAYTPENPVWYVPLYQWARPRPVHPRDVPEYLDWWYENTRRRIPVVMELCDFLSLTKPRIVLSEEAKGRLKP